MQHFWSLAVQGQFYLLAPLLVAAAVLLARRAGPAGRPGVRGVLLTALTAAFLVSLCYSVLTTASDQRWAYFDTGARLWEPALGGVLALILPHLRIPRLARVALGWIGLAALVLCGVLIEVSTLFPGYVALWPTCAAALVIIAGTTGSRLGADRLLGWRPLGHIGDLAYPLYLWHWPVLVFYLEVTGRHTPGLLGGCSVLGLSFALTVASRRLVDNGVRRISRGRAGPRPSLAVGAAFLLPVLLTVGGSVVLLDKRQEASQELASDRTKYPGAEVIAEPALVKDLPEVPVYPDLTAPEDKWLLHTNGCNVELRGQEPVTCEFGSAASEHTIALVGNSHAGHWFPPLLEIAEANDWRLVTMTKNGCQFSSDTQHWGGKVFTDCEAWKEGAMAELAELRPDAVFTTSTRAEPAGNGAGNVTAGAPGVSGERLPGGYVERWQELEALGIDVVAIRDTPRLRFDAPECVDRYGADACVEELSYSMNEESPAEELEKVPGNVAFIDLTDYFCPGGTCPVVVGNVLVMSDDNHLTATFSRSLAPMLRSELKTATGW